MTALPCYFSALGFSWNNSSMSSIACLMLLPKRWASCILKHLRRTFQSTLQTFRTETSSVTMLNTSVLGKKSKWQHTHRFRAGTFAGNMEVNEVLSHNNISYSITVISHLSEQSINFQNI